MRCVILIVSKMTEKRKNMKNTKTTNGKWEHDIHHFYKDGKIVRSIYLDREFIDNEFHMGRITIQTNQVISIGECMWHDEDSLLKTFDGLLEMMMGTDWDEISREQSTTIKIIKVGAE